MTWDRKRLAVHLHPPAQRAVRGGHPWVYADGIERMRHAGEAGDLAVIFDHRNRFLAIGLYDPHSPIRVRILHQGEPLQIDGAWLVERMRAAQQIREPLLAQATTGYRLIHGENDGLPGLVVDRYDTTLVVKIYTSAWLPHLDDIVAGLAAVANPECVLLRLSRTVARHADPQTAADGRILFGELPALPILFEENGLHFEVDPVRGQKTGFFLDQRDNRSLVGQYAAGRSVLNVFSYTGGFSVYAARGGARSVASLDASRPALLAAERNFRHNQSVPAVGAAGHRTLAGDAFELLPHLRDGGELFDMVVLDPPSFAKAGHEVDRALRSYERVIRMGLDLVGPGGMLVAASCTSRVSADQLADAVQGAATGARRRLQIIRQTGHALDHPVEFPEGAYLKCVYASLA